MADLTAGAAQFADLARRLKDAGEVTLRRELYKAIDDSARPVAEVIRSFMHLVPYMPDVYAAVLAPDVRVTISKRASRDPGVSILCVPLGKQRKITRLDRGLLTHPLFGDRKHWHTQAAPLGGMRAGFFSDPCEESAPEVRDAILAAMRDVGVKAAGGA
jgi:hypothetical protein